MQTIIQGGKSTLLLRLKQYSNGIEGDPVDFTGITDIQTCFQNTDGTELMLSLLGGAILILGSPLLGKLSIALTSAQTSLLALVDTAILELSLIYGSSDPIKIQVPNAYSVVASQC